MGSAKFPNFSNFHNFFTRPNINKKAPRFRGDFLYSRKAIPNPLQLQLFEGQADGLFDAEVGVLFEEFFEYFF